jgi:sugar phosphate isomerase/epimerase
MIEEKYNELVNTQSDINEHLPTLRRYAEECKHITEMGVRWVVSTYAFLAAKPSTLISIDMQMPNNWGVDITPLKDEAKNIGCDFNFQLANTLEIEIEQTDLLFIDTWHAYKQLKSELNLHHSKVNKYIIFHDTTTYEFNDEGGYDAFGFIGDGKGLWPAIEEFLEEHPEWIIKERFTNNNGLTILYKK